MIRSTSLVAALVFTAIPSAAQVSALDSTRKADSAAKAPQAARGIRRCGGHVRRNQTRRSRRSQDRSGARPTPRRARERQGVARQARHHRHRSQSVDQSPRLHSRPCSAVHPGGELEGEFDIVPKGDATGGSVGVTARVGSVKVNDTIEFV
jgi:hypothetical protein